MGLYISAGEAYEDKDVSIGYIGYSMLRKMVVKAYDEHLGKLYDEWFKLTISPRDWLTPYVDLRIERLTNELNEKLPQGLNIFVSHSDCDGTFSPQECREVYAVLKGLELKCEDERDEMLNRKFKGIVELFRLCSEKEIELKYF
jgi:hypothetical protein